MCFVWTNNWAKIIFHTPKISCGMIQNHMIHLRFHGIISSILYHLFSMIRLSGHWNTGRTQRCSEFWDGRTPNHIKHQKYIFSFLGHPTPFFFSFLLCCLLTWQQQPSEHTLNLLCKCIKSRATASTIVFRLHKSYHAKLMHLHFLLPVVCRNTPCVCSHSKSVCFSKW